MRTTCKQAPDEELHNIAVALQRDFVSTKEESIENIALQIAFSCPDRVLKQNPLDVPKTLAVALHILAVQSSDAVSANFPLWEKKGAGQTATTAMTIQCSHTCSNASAPKFGDTIFSPCNH